MQCWVKALRTSYCLLANAVGCWDFWNPKRTSPFLLGDALRTHYVPAVGQGAAAE